MQIQFVEEKKKPLSDWKTRSNRAYVYENSFCRFYVQNLPPEQFPATGHSV